GVGGDVDDPPVVLRAEMRDAGPGQTEGATGVDGQHVVPVLVGELPDHFVPQDARVVDDHVDPAGLRHDARNGGFDGLGAADVDVHAACTDIGRCFADLVAVVVQQEHVRAGAHEEP